MTDTPAYEAEFSDFYEQTSRSLWAYLSRSSQSDSVADDLLQETYFRYLQSGWRSLQPAERRFYLFRIGTNVLHDHFPAYNDEPASLWLRMRHNHLREHDTENRPGKYFQERDDQAGAATALARVRRGV